MFKKKVYNIYLIINLKYKTENKTQLMALKKADVYTTATKLQNKIT